MSKAIAIAAALLMIISCSPSKQDPRLVQRIQNIENGLEEFNPGPPDPAKTPLKMKRAERMAVHKIPGVSIAVIDGNKIQWAKSYGVLSAASGAPVTTESIFQAASTTKMLVAAIVLHFAGKGLLDLDRDINTYLKSWKVPENKLTKEKKVTLRLIMTHQSGLPMTNFPYDDGPPPSLVQVLKGEPPARNKPAVVEFTPGSKWQYSNIGYVVIQLLLEDVTGRSLAGLMQDVIFKPIKMKSSTLVYPLEAGLRAREALPHDVDGKPGEPALHATAQAQGGLMTTPSDLALFTIELMKAYRGESGLILTQDMARTMLRPELDLDPALLGMPIREGLGVMLSAEGAPFYFGHPGDNYPGATSWVIGYPELGTGIVIMTNGAKGTILAMEIMPAFVNEYVAAKGR
ncbi:MAG: beta-lactamase family protein [Candidatus Aminicenantes bacterium]|nr:beta-lactamase family protein [Candidatus Aminicenantes bacterium]